MYAGNLLKKMHLLLSPLLGGSPSLADRPLRQLCIMDREEEFSVNAKSAPRPSS